MTADLALVEDSPAAHDFLKKFISELPPGSERFRISRVCEEPLTAENYEFMLQTVRDHHGALAMILDIRLYEDGSKERARSTSAYLKVSSQVRAGLKAFPTDKADILSRVLRRFDTGVGLPKFTMDGPEFAFAAIENQQIRPLLILIATRTEVSDDVSKLLNAYAQVVRGADSAFLAFTQGPVSLVDLTQDPQGIEAGQAELARLLDGFASVFDGLMDPRTRLDSWLLDVGLVHPESNQREHVKKAMNALLGIQEEEFESKLWPHLGRHALELAKSSGTGGRSYLGAVAAWFYALLAYLHCGDKRPWHEVFHPSELSDLEENWDWPITPSLSPKVEEEGSLKQAVHRYFSLCTRLFANESDEGKVAGPLRKVTLSKNGLSFQLRFDAWTNERRQAADLMTSGSLVEKMARWRDAYLKNREGLPQRWASKSSPNESGSNPSSVNTTSRAMIDWLLTCVMNDAIYCTVSDSLLDASFWKMKLRRPVDSRHETEVIFCE